jgi:hypothetical protein
VHATSEIEIVSVQARRLAPSAAGPGCGGDQQSRDRPAAEQTGLLGDPHDSFRRRPDPLRHCPPAPVSLDRPPRRTPVAPSDDREHVGSPWGSGGGGRLDRPAVKISGTPAHWLDDLLTDPAVVLKGGMLHPALVDLVTGGKLPVPPGERPVAGLSSGIPAVPGPGHRPRTFPRRRLGLRGARQLRDPGRARRQPGTAARR